MARSDFVRIPGSLVGTFSTERFQRSRGDQREHLFEKPSLCPHKEVMKSSEVTKLGRYPTTKRFLTIGIASVARPNGANYLLQTTQSLIDHTSDLEKKDIYIVILLADLQKPEKSTMRRELFQTFGKYIEQGFLTVIEAYPEYYPELNNIKVKFRDSAERRAWRSKQNTDNSFLMCYCKDFSHYYIHLEDDVKSSPSFFSKLRDYITETKTDWPRLNVAVKGCVAKVYHSHDLENMASYFYLMYDEMPIDWLMDRWIAFKYPVRYEKEPFLASLFQHAGVQSSLSEKGPNYNLEPFFDQYDQKYKGLNPPATVTSSLASYQGHAQDAYDKGSGYFWSKKPQENDYVLITFHVATTVQKIFVDTGSYRARKDSLDFGVLQASFQSGDNSETQMSGNGSCGNFQTIGLFNKGQAKESLDESRKVTCLKILVTKHQDKYIFLREIDVWGPTSHSVTN